MAVTLLADRKALSSFLYFAAYFLKPLTEVMEVVDLANLAMGKSP